MKKENLFEPMDIVVLEKEPKRSYVIVSAPKNTIMKNGDGWLNAYVYLGEDKYTGKDTYFVREKMDFENNFVLKSSVEKSN